MWFYPPWREVSLWQWCSLQVLLILSPLESSLHCTPPPHSLLQPDHSSGPTRKGHWSQQYNHTIWFNIIMCIALWCSYLHGSITLWIIILSFILITKKVNTVMVLDLCVPQVMLTLHGSSSFTGPVQWRPGRHSLLRYLTPSLQLLLHSLQMLHSPHSAIEDQTLTTTLQMHLKICMILDLYFSQKYLLF